MIRSKQRKSEFVFVKKALGLMDTETTKPPPGFFIGDDNIGTHNEK
jgi:hypothetical protein